MNRTGFGGEGVYSAYNTVGYEAKDAGAEIEREEQFVIYEFASSCDCRSARS